MKISILGSRIAPALFGVAFTTTTITHNKNPTIQISMKKLRSINTVASKVFLNKKRGDKIIILTTAPKQINWTRLGPTDPSPVTAQKKRNKTKRPLINTNQTPTPNQTELDTPTKTAVASLEPNNNTANSVVVAATEDKKKQLNLKPKDKKKKIPTTHGNGSHVPLFGPKPKVPVLVIR